MATCYTVDDPTLTEETFEPENHDTELEVKDKIFKKSDEARDQKIKHKNHSRLNDKYSRPKALGTDELN